jgi:hypothetical protein
MDVISRREAKSRGLKRYFTGKPCKNGHVTERVVGKHMCMECARLKQRFSRNKAKKGDRKRLIEAMYIENNVHNSAHNIGFVWAERWLVVRGLISKGDVDFIDLRPVSRAESIENEWPNYFTGEPCKNGHIDLRNTKTTVCLCCAKERKRRHRAA